MPLARDEFRTIDEDGRGLLDLSEDTTQGTVYRFLLKHSGLAFRQREIVDGVDVPKGSVGPTLTRLESRGLVEHRDRYWAIADAEQAVVSAGSHTVKTADELDGGFSSDDIETWMETAVEPIQNDPIDENEA